MTSSGTYNYSLSTGEAAMDEPKECIVYCATNTVLPTRGGLYIGMTQKSLEERKHRHGYLARKGSHLHFHCAIRKYGLDGFLWQIIDRQPTYRAALASERYHIAALKSSYSLYNKTDGGGGVKGLKFSAEARQKMSLAKKGKPNHWSGGRMPQCVRDKMSIAARNREPRAPTDADRLVFSALSKKGNAARRKAVVCLTDGIRYQSVTEAGKSYGLTSGQISRLCKTSAKTRRGLNFSYVESAP